jgi:hypothetical protein
MIPPNDPHKQVSGPDLARSVPAHDDVVVPPVCPACGRRLPPLFDVRTSGLLDYVVLAQDVLCDLKAALEEERLP